MMRQLVEAPGDSLDSDVGCVKPLPGEAPSNPTHSTSRILHSRLRSGQEASSCDKDIEIGLLKKGA
ncbi:hypothetical protein GOBAR_AA34232 [Gossypium barbadense]|uniref:Uncharacterized protein n=1 Tax=Gossypium barbadense TaxID=3634 RepID=A0A2P5W5V7_GOSBA|nr:hypothetical protein GOBAR_AA34232 [Gossypium barbadense]